MTDQPRQIEGLIRRASADVIRKLQLRTWQALTSATPVDTGFARANWTPTVGSPVSQRLERPAKRAAARAAATQRRAANQAAAESIASTYTIEAGRVFITNPVPYVVFLDQGSSAQAPARFVERAIGQAIRSLGRMKV